MKRKSGNILVAVLLILLIITTSIAGYLYLQQRGPGSGKHIIIPNPAATPAPTPTIAPVPAPTIKPDSSPKVEQAKLVSTAGWKQVNFSDISFKIPSGAEASLHEYPETCQKGFDKCYRIKHYVPNSDPYELEIALKKYQGGSRRQEAGLEGTYNYRELDFGTRTGLEAVFVCQISACMPTRTVLFVVGNNLIALNDPTIYTDKTMGEGSIENPYGTLRESPVTNTIISTIK